MTDRLQPGIHPDADQISLFLEGAAAEHERAEMLVHLAQCATCRDVVFLAQGAEADVRPAATPERTPRGRWWMPFGLAAVALACAAILFLYMRTSVGPTADRQIATAERPVNPPAMESERALPPASTSGNQGTPQPQVFAKRKPAPGVGSGSGGGMGAGVYQAAPPPSPVAALSSEAYQDARGNQARFSQNNSPEAGATIAPPQASPSVTGGQAAQAPAVPSSSQSGPTAVQNYAISQLSIGGQKPRLQILHDQGTSEGLGEVSGVVTDSTGTVIPRARVSLQATAEDTMRQIAAGPDGRFRFPDVPAGRYELRVDAPGFMAGSQQLELKSRDVAMLDSVLHPGAAAESVIVTAASVSMDTSQAEITNRNMKALDANLPGGAAAMTRVSIAERVVAADAAGKLYLSKNAGKSWKKVKPKWTGKVAQLGVVPGQAAEAAKKAAGEAQVFQLTTDAGVVWTSEDGKHWRARD